MDLQRLCIFAGTVTGQASIFALRQSETGTRVEEVCRKMGISEATFLPGTKLQMLPFLPITERVHASLI